MNGPDEFSSASLTPRELEVCSFVARGFTAHEIGAKLDISPRTVEAHIYSAARMIPGRGTPMKRIIRFFSTRPGELDT